LILFYLVSQKKLNSMKTENEKLFPLPSSSEKLDPPLLNEQKLTLLVR